MTSARCPACGAAVQSGAPWCTLCYADLRPQPVASAAAPTAPPSRGGGRHRAAPRHAATASAQPVVEMAEPLPAAPVDLLDPQLDRPVMRRADAATGPRTWPCLTCGHAVPMDEPACTHCGAAFLAGADDALALKLPVVGDVRSITPGGRFALMAGGAIAVTVALVALLFLLGHLV